MNMFKNKKWKLLLISIPIIILIIFLVYVNDYYRAMPEAISFMSSDDNVEFIQNSPWIEYTSKNKEVTKGLILYPGGKVEAQAYAPLAKTIAESGFRTVIVPMPFKLAVFSPNKAEEVISSYSQIDEWYIGGHSLGGAMASQFTYNNPDIIQGLILLASYPPNSSDMSSSKIRVLSIAGTEDGLADKDKIEASKKLLPKSTYFVWVEGGNHSQMGWYGFQDGDNTAAITREKQQEIITNSIVQFMIND